LRRLYHIDQGKVRSLQGSNLTECKLTWGLRRRPRIASSVLACISAACRKFDYPLLAKELLVLDAGHAIYDTPFSLA